MSFVLLLSMSYLEQELPLCICVFLPCALLDYFGPAVRRSGQFWPAVPRHTVYRRTAAWGLHRWCFQQWRTTWPGTALMGTVLVGTPKVKREKQGLQMHTCRARVVTAYYVAP